MRLGKTKTVIRALKKFKGKILIVCPKSVINTWIDELEMEEITCYGWFTSKEIPRVMRHGISRITHSPRWTVQNYEAVTRLKPYELDRFDCVVADESVRIKEPQTKLTKFFIQNFRSAKKRIILSGNPAPNSPLEYYSQMQFLQNEWMGCDNFWKYRHKYFGSDIQGWNWWVRASAKDVIRIELQKSASILTRRQVGVENKKVYQKRVVEMPESLKKQYRMMEKKFVMELPDGRRLETKYILPQLSYLQQMAGGHILKEEMSSFKINELVELMMGELKNEPVLVWCRFRWEIENIIAMLLKKKILCSFIHGGVPLGERKKIQEKFQNGEIQVLVMQTQTGKYGLNLSRADTAIYYSNTLVPDDRNQSEMRIEHNSKHTPLLIIDLVTKDTIDEQILRSLQSKYTQSRFFLGDIVDKLKEKYGK